MIIIHTPCLEQILYQDSNVNITSTTCWTMPPGMESTGPWRILCSRIYFKLFFLSFQEVSRMNLFIWESLEVPPLYKWQGNIIIHQHEMGFLTFSKEYLTFENMKVAFRVKCKCIHLIWLKEKSKAAHAARIQFFLVIHSISALAPRKREVPKENIQSWEVEAIQVVSLQ